MCESETVERLGDDDIAEVRIKETAQRYYHDYSERPMRYMVRLSGENRWRRVYAQPIGNVSVIYLKVKGKDIYCEMALERALHRANQEFMKGN